MSWRDFSPEDHKALDTSVKFLSLLPFDQNAPDILNAALTFSLNHYAEIWPLESTVLTKNACKTLLSSQKGLKEDLRTAHKTGSYKNIRSRRECMPISAIITVFTQASLKLSSTQKGCNIILP
jgi:hypothetical protein